MWLCTLDKRYHTAIYTLFRTSISFSKYTFYFTTLNTPYIYNCALSSRLTRHFQIYLPVYPDVYHWKCLHIHFKIHSAVYLLLCFRVYCQHLLNYPSDCTAWYSHYLLDCTLHCKLSIYFPVQPLITFKYTSKLALMPSLNCTRRYSFHLLDSTLPITLSRY